MINQYNIKDIFDYKDGELIWKINRIGNKGIGSIAGTCSDRYKKVVYKQKAYLVHRLIWVWHNGDIDKNMVIDHRDNNGFNNKIENLKLLCPNCHSLTETYKNIGSRKSTRLKRKK